MKKLLLSLGLLLSLSLSLTGCNDDNAKAQGDDDLDVDVLIDVISGEVLENPDGDGFILVLEVSPITVFIEERPGNRSGSISTEDFLEEFNEIIGDVPPNAILSFRAEEGTAVAVAVKLNSVVFDSTDLTPEILVTPLEKITNLSTPGTSVELKDIADVDSTFPPALLWIHSMTTTAPTTTTCSGQNVSQADACFDLPGCTGNLVCDALEVGGGDPIQCVCGPAGNGNGPSQPTFSP